MKITIPKVRHRRTRGLGAVKGNKPLIAVGLAGALIVGGMLPTALAADDPNAPSPTPRASMVTPNSVSLTPGQTWTGTKTVKTTKVPPKVDVMFVLDNTGSMKPPIEWVSKGLKDAVSRLAAAGARDLQMGIVSYGDNDATQDCVPGWGSGTKEWFVPEVALGANSVTTLVDKLAQISQRVFDQHYCNGADPAESTFSAVQKVAADTQWRPDAARYVISVTDAPWKIQNNVMAGKQPSNVAGLIKVLEATDVYLEIQGVNCFSNSCEAARQSEVAGRLPAISGADVAKAIKAAPSLPNDPVLYVESDDAKELNDAIVVSTVGVNPIWEMSHKTQCVYESDGAASTDIAVSLNPAKQSVATGDSASFDEVATATTTPGRYDDTTVCTTQFFINGNDAGVDYRQIVSMKVEDPGKFQITKTADPVSGTNIVPGESVKYTVVAENTTKKKITGATFTDDLNEILDDANVAASSIKTNGPGKAELVGKTIVWTGDLDAGQKATVTYEAVVPKPMKTGGNLVLKNNVSSSTGLSTCPAGSVAPECNTTHPISGFLLSKTADNMNPKIGDKVTFTITGQNVSLTPLAKTLSDDLSDVFDDADYNGDISSSVPAAQIVGNKMTWSGTLAPMETVTITYSVTIKADATAVGAPGNGSISNSVSAPGPTDCVEGDPNPPPHCIVPPTPIRGITVVKSAVNPPNEGVVVNGDTVKFQIVATNTGGVDINDAKVIDEMKDVLDDASYQNDAKINPAANGKVELKGTQLIWTGKLAKGETVTITYSVKIGSPPKGNKTIKNLVFGPDTNCEADPSAPGCSETLPTPSLEVAKVVVGSPSVVHPGDRVSYKLSANNTGKVDLPTAELTDNLTGVLDDATFDIADVVVNPAGAGKVTFDAATNVLKWVGPIAMGERVEVTYTVVVKDVLGDHNLKNKVISNVPGSTCTPDSTDPDCETSTEASSVQIKKTANPAGSVQPGKPVDYTITIKNDSKGVAKNVKVSDDLSMVLDDAKLDEASLKSSLGAKPVFDSAKKTITWTGDIPAGTTVTITYKAVANYPSTGDLVMKNSVVSDTEGSTCKPGNSNPDCGTATDVAGDVVKKTHDIPAGTQVRPGQKVTYTVTVQNNSKVPTTASKFTDNMSDVLDDAKYNNDVAISPNTHPLPVFDASNKGKEMTWVGPLAVNEVVTITYSVTVNDPRTGNGQLINSLTGGAICEEGDPNPPIECRPTPPVVGGFSIIKTSDVTGKAKPGSVVTYTIKGKNEGEAKITGAKFTDNLKKVLDDATFVDGSLNATVPAANYDKATQIITWTGDLDKGQTVTVTYKVKVNEPVSGDMIMTNTVVSDTPGTNCPAGSTDPACTSTSEVGGFTIKKTSDLPAGTVAKAGTEVTYTVTATNNTLHNVPTATFTDNLKGVLDDAVFKDGSIVVVPNVGKAEFNATDESLTWSGPLDSKQSVTVRYTVTVGKDMGGDHMLNNGVSSMDENTNCPPDSKDPDCSTSNESGGFNVKKTADVPNGEAVERGKILTYTVVAHNDSKNDVTGAKWSDNLDKVLDDATLVSGPTVVSGGGTVKFDDKTKTITWTGDLAKGAKSTVTYQVKVNDHNTTTAGDNSLVNEIKSEGDLGNCPPGNTDPDCAEVHPIKGLTIVKTSSVPNGETVDAGSDVIYTVKVKNTGSEKYLKATFTDDMTNVLKSAVLDKTGLNNAATVGKVTFDEKTNVLSWEGDLDPGQEAVVTYKVTVNSSGHSTTSKLSNKVESDTPGTNCPPGNNDPLCNVPNPISSVHVSKKVNTDQPALVGQQLIYTVKVENTGAKDLTSIYIEDDLTDVIDDGWVVKNSWDATSGTVGFVRGDDKITWTGDLKIGESATFTYKVEVAEPFQSNGNRIMTNTVIGGANSNCFATSADPVCKTRSTVSAIIWVLSNDKAPGANVAPGSPVTYKVEGINAGGADETGIDYKLDLNGVLDDAVIDESSVKVAVRNAPAGSEARMTPTFDAKAGTMSWSGDLSQGEEFDVTFQAAVKDNTDGDRALVAKIVSTKLGTNCPADSTDARCVLSNRIQGLTFTAKSDIDPAIGFAQANQVVNYTVEVANSGGGDVPAASFSYDLSKLLDDAEIVGDITTTSTTTRAASVAKLNGAGTAIDWTGSLGDGETAIVKFAAKVNVTGNGDRQLDTLVVSSDLGTNCGAGSGDINCATSDKVREINFSKTADKTGRVKAGDVITYSVKINNVGRIDYADVQFSDNLSEVLDDATFVKVSQDSGAAVYNAPVISWKGALAAGQSATITYSVKVKDGRPGDGVLFNRVTSGLPDTNCPAGSTDPACSTVTKIDLPVKLGTIALPVTGIELGQIVSGAGFALLLGAGALLIARRRTVRDEEA